MNRRNALITVAGAAAAMTMGSSPASQIAEPIGPALKPPHDGVSVAFVIGPWQNVIDLAGPWETFQDVGFKLSTVSDTTDPLQATGGLIITPEYTYVSYPHQPNVIVMGAQGNHSKEKIAWIRQAAKNADLVMSVCTGAFLLAQTGLLDGLRATTHHDSYDKFEKTFPNVHLVRGPRYVDNGKFATAGGLTSGIELALTVVQRYMGAQIAQQNAYYMEYNRSAKRPVLALSP